MSTPEIVIASFARTPFGRANKGLLRDTRPDEMAAFAIEHALDRAEGITPEMVQDVVMGCAFPEGEQGRNVARIATLMAGLPETVPAMTVNRFCSSGLQTIAIAADRIKAGDIDVAIAGGTESMSMVPIGGNKPTAHPEFAEQMPEVYLGMGLTAENVAERFSISAAQQNEFALRSHQLAVEARERGFFDGEIVPMETEFVGEGGSRREVTAEQDGNVRPQTNMEALSGLPAVFKRGGTVTPGTASPLTDGAAAVVVTTAEKAEQIGLEPLGYYRNLQVVGVPPEIMGVGPVPAVRKLLDVNDLDNDDIDMVELNEAFASQAVYCVEELEIEMDKVNVNGGALAIGHPLGVSGTRMAGTLLRALREQGGGRGIVTMCVGGGQGAAGLFEV